MDTASAFYSMGVALGLGLLVGLQRERAGSELAGFRTFALITVLGAVCGLLSGTLGGWPVGAGFVAVAGATAMGNFISVQKSHTRDSGITTEAAILVMFAVGVLAAVGPVKVAVATGVGVALLLQGKERLHGLAARVGDKDMRAIMVFAAITFVVLPVLPDQAYGPFKVLNPHNIWLMVVLVVGISLGGYLAYKLVGQRGGMLLAGLLGGMISSTATTVTFARRSRETEGATAPALVVILIATGVVYLRLLGEISVVSAKFVQTAAWPMGVMFATGVAGMGAAWVMCRDGVEGLPEQENPTQIKPALMFALLYAGVILAVAAAREYLGDRGTYLVALVSGLTDTDAITLSSSRLVEHGKMDASVGWRAIVLALMSNLAFKAGIVWVMGTRRLFTLVVAAFAAQVAAGAAMLMLW